MKTRYSSVLAILLFPLSILAQSRSVSTSGTVSGTVAGVAGPETRTTFVYRGELGKWWQNSDIAKKLQLSDGQLAQLDQTFYDHKLKLIDYGADMEKQDLKLQALLDADVPNEGQVEAQVDQVLAARGKLEREFTFMNLDLRKVLSLDQWRQLKAVRGQAGGGGDRVFFRKVLPPGAAPPPMQLQPGAGPVLSLPPLPPPPSDEMY
jgi:Spy/CpxP family protein refolding chaperone